MPLTPGKSAIGHNISEMESAGHPRDQAIAAALREAGVQKRADGGSTWQEKADAREIAHAGPIPFKVPGRTDRIPVHVLSGSYVLPADIVSGLGEGNTLAGNEIIKSMFSGATGPYNSMMARANGGRAEQQHVVPVIVAGGEYVLSPDEVAHVGEGDLDAGHAVLDHLVKSLRKSHIDTLKNLPGPAKD